MAFLGLTGCSTMTKSTSSDGTLQAKTFQPSRSASEKVKCLVFLPEGYHADSAKRWPLMLFLHGSGERGTNVWKVAFHGPPKYVKTHPDFPFILVSPQCPSGKSWQTESLLSLLDDVTGKYRVDTNRVYLTGLSMGGYGVWSLGTAYPERFAAIAPICGGGETITVLLSVYDKLAALKALPVWAFHGAKDPVVSLEESERMVKALKAAGCKDVQLTVYPEVEHNSWEQTYNNPELYQWLLRHELKPVK